MKRFTMLVTILLISVVTSVSAQDTFDHRSIIMPSGKLINAAGFAVFYELMELQALRAEAQMLQLNCVRAYFANDEDNRHALDTCMIQGDSIIRQIREMYMLKVAEFARLIDLSDAAVS